MTNRGTSGTVINSTAWMRSLSESFPSSYTVWRDTSTTPATIRAECNVAGGTDFNGTDASTVIQAAIDALPNGGSVFIRAGDYTLTATLTITKNYITLKGEGRASHLYMDADNIPIIYVHGTPPDLPNHASCVRGITITDLYLEGCGGLAGGSQHGIWFYYVIESFIDRVWIYGVHGSGIKLDTITYILSIQSCFIIDVSGWGMELLGTGDTVINNMKIFGALLDGYMSNSSGGNTLSGSEIDSNAGHGIVLCSASNETIVGNLFYDNDYLNTSIYSGIRILDGGGISDNNVIVGNRFINNDHYEIEITGACHNNLIASNIFIGTDHDGIISDGGIATKIEGNVGYNPRGNIATPYPAGAGYIADVVAAQAFPTTHTNYTISGSPKLIIIYGGTVSAILIDGVATGLTSGTFHLSPGQILHVDWTLQPSSTVYAQ